VTHIQPVGIGTTDGISVPIIKNGEPVIGSRQGIAHCDRGFVSHWASSFDSQVAAAEVAAIRLRKIIKGRKVTAGGSVRFTRPTVAN
jgi:hypothetical protein